MSKRIVVIGGGYAGYEIAKGLEKHAEVTLIEPRSAFVHVPATIRALVAPDLMEQIVLPYSGLLKKGRWMQGRAAAIARDHVLLEDGTRIDADLIVAATGSGYAAPFKPAGDDIAAFREAHAAVAAELVEAQSVAIAGAGPVGIELAGEITAGQPGKTVTLISADKRLMPHYPEKMSRQLEAKLSAQGVTLVLGDRVVDLWAGGGPYKGSVTLASGGQIAADLIFPAVGAKAASSPLEALPGVKRDAAGRFETDGWLRPSKLENVFVAGDAAAAGDHMTIVATARQNPWLIKALKALVKGKPVDGLKPYSPWKKAPILLPLGPWKGSSWLFMTLGDGVTSKMKGRELFIPRYRKAFGLS